MMEVVNVTHLEFAQLFDRVLLDLVSHLNLSQHVLQLAFKLLLGADGRRPLLALLLQVTLHLTKLSGESRESGSV